MYIDYIDNIGWNFNFWNSVSAPYLSIDTTFSYVKGKLQSVEQLL